jgi:hypothetical protein
MNNYCGTSPTLKNSIIWCLNAELQKMPILRSNLMKKHFHNFIIHSYIYFFPACAGK